MSPNLQPAQVGEFDQPEVGEFEVAIRGRVRQTVGQRGRKCRLHLNAGYGRRYRRGFIFPWLSLKSDHILIRAEITNILTNFF